jgi:CBS domain-containing protein
MKIRDLLRSKGPRVITVAPEVPIQEALSVLVRHNIGALVVSDGSIRGIVTERDLLRAAAEDLPRLTTARVRDLMTVEVITATPDAEIGEVMDTMTERRIRHLPIVDGDGLCGIISIGDVVNALRQSVETENRYLHAYIEGR